MNGIKEGDEVRILTRTRSRHCPEGGHVGHVVKVGRKYATAEYTIPGTTMGGEEKHWNRTVEFDMATGYERGAFSTTTCDYVRTPEQAEHDRRRSAALSVLKEHGLERRLGARDSHSLECLEAIAEVLERLDRNENSEEQNHG